MPLLRDDSWLLKRNPPSGRVLREKALWWNVIRQAACDLRFSHRSSAIDALEFLRSTGLWLAAEILGIPDGTYQKEVAALLVRRNRELTPVYPIAM